MFSLSGVGKTTLVKKVCESVLSTGVSINGFYTEEVRERGRRVGFDVVTVTGDRGRLSRVRYLLLRSSLYESVISYVRLLLLPPTLSLSDPTCSSESAAGRREYRVGQYAVDLQSFESLVLPLFKEV